MGENGVVSCTIEDRIATITLDRPERRNAVDAKLARELHAVITACETDPDVAVTILTGAGNAFCAGMDLAAFSAGEAEGILHGPGRFAGFVGVERGKPVIAAVNGPALAGGFEIVLACDMAIAVDTAIFGLPESRRGLIAGAGGVFRLAQRLPPALANELILTGDPVDAQRALELGLLNRVVAADELMPTARGLARKVAESAPMSVALGLDLARRAASGEEDVLWEINDAYLGRVVRSQDAQEGARAFLEKRPPAWRGR